MTAPYYALSLGAGQQSSFIAAASALRWTAPNGYTFPPLDAIVFADTGSESRDTYDHLAKFGKWLAGHGHEIHVVRRYEKSLGDLLVDRMTGVDAKSIPQIPAYTLSVTGNRGMSNKDCSMDLKGTQIDKHVGKLAREAKRYKTVVQLIGFGLEEVHRMRTNPHEKRGWKYEFPLVDARMRRGDVLKQWREWFDWTPAPSACVFCPFRGSGDWRRMKEESPEDYAEAQRVDAAIRDSSKAGLRDACFIAKERVPLDEAVALNAKQGTLFDDAGCGEGVCFV